MKKKKIVFSSILLPGHLNVCSSIGTSLLNNHSDKIEVYFIVDHSYVDKLKQFDKRFNVRSFAYKNENKLRTNYMIDTLEACLKMTLIEKAVLCWRMFLDDDLLIEADTKTEMIIKELKPDFLLCDQNFHLPSMLNSGVPYAFICSYNPLFFALDQKRFPLMGCDARLDELDKIERFSKEFEPHRIEIQKKMYQILDERGAKYDNKSRPIDQIISDHFNIYVYPSCCDYYSDFINQNDHHLKLWQIDSVVLLEKVPEPYKLPENFKRLPGKIVYVSLGTLFSSYTYLMERLLNMLDKFDDAKFIVSLGKRGDEIKLPSEKFIGENYIDQLAVLQICDAMISHGGNNSLCESFFFGVPLLILPIIVDQINNATRIEETELGFKLDILNYTEEELFDRLSKLLNDQVLKVKLRKASERIQKDNKINSVVQKIVDYLFSLDKS